MGIERSRIPLPGGERHRARLWTMEIMAGAILALKEAGLPVHTAYLRVEHLNLYMRIVNYPGGWKMVVTEAGFDPVAEARGRLGPIKRFVWDERKS